ncbi:MAG: hypothetical protein IJX99_08390 [Clostridia bacterium]|nr:hypothetical protein [Clostridia bacterium]
MSIYIDKHFYSDLFITKKVNCYNKFYSLLFNTIWPRTENFKNFLSSSDVSLKIEYAKKIYEDFTLVNNTFLPPFTILNVLEDQYKNIETQSKGYIPQDHVIHSIHLYILGIYIFFNSSVLSLKVLNSKTNMNKYEAIKDFILKWQLFSLYHDVGYFFEDNKVKEKDLSLYEKIYDFLLKHFITKNLSRALTFKSIIEKYPSYFNDDFLNSHLGPWYDINERKISKDQLKNQLHEFSNFFCFDHIINEEEFCQILPIIKNKKYLVSVYNENGVCVALIVRKNFEILQFYSKNPIIKDNLFVNNILDTTIPNYSFKYYLPDIHDETFWLKIVNEPLVISNLCSQLPHKLNTTISMNPNSINKVLFDINDWLNEIFSIDNLQEVENYEKTVSTNIKNQFNEQIISFVRNFSSEKTFDEQNIEKYIANLANELRIRKKEIKDSIIKCHTDSYNEIYAITHTFIDFYKVQTTNLSNSSWLSNTTKFLEFFHIENSEIKTEPFVHDKNNKFQTDLFNSLSKKAIKLRTSIDLLRNYRSPYVPLDHGVISASLLFQMACLNREIKSHCLKELTLTWDTSYTDETAFLDFCSECIFSVLLHNIYTQKSNPKFGIDYIHDIDKDAFSYFCTFCDTIQKWGRPKKTDLSKTNLPLYNFLEDEFDIDVYSNNIFIKCNKNNINAIQNIIDSAEDYLPGISKLIATKEFENSTI